MKWNELDSIENVGNGFALMKDEQKMYFGEFIDNDFLVYGDEGSWCYHFYPDEKYYYLKLEIVQ